MTSGPLRHGAGRRLRPVTASLPASGALRTQREGARLLKPIARALGIRHPGDFGKDDGKVRAALPAMTTVQDR